MLLRHQHGVSERLNKNHGIRPIDKYDHFLSAGKISEHDSEALRHERALGVGISGNTNVLNFLFSELKRHDDTFPVEQAKLMTAAHLCFGGGHSINEAYSVFEYMRRGNFEPLPLSELAEISDFHRKAIDFAFEKVLAASAELAST